MREIHFGRPILGDAERDAIEEVLSGPVLVHGPRAARFEADFAAFSGAPHAVSVSSCTAAMHLVWFVLGVGPGDEVIVSAQTHTATAHAVELLGARPVFVDSEPRSGNLDPELVRAAVTERTVGIAVVHYLGEPVDIAPIKACADEHGLFLLEDCALAVGTSIDGTHAGMLGDVGCFSFYPVKHLTTAEGGMAITGDATLADRLRRARAFGVDRTVDERTVPGVYDVPTLGLNYRMNELQAALGSAQLRRVPGFLEARRRNFTALHAALAEVDGLTMLPASAGARQSSYYCLVALLDDELAAQRPEIVEYLRSVGVGTSVYYPAPVPLLTYYRERYGHRREEFPVASRISEASIALPVGPHLDEDDMRYVAESVRDAVEKAW